jgi:hypothetical protein
MKLMRGWPSSTKVTISIPLNAGPVLVAQSGAVNTSHNHRIKSEDKNDIRGKTY